jgi:dTDP-4-dehydrorhamnose reductase
MNRLALNIVVIGRDGQIAWELRRCQSAIGSIVALGRPEIDLSRPDSIREMFRRLHPNVVINAAAYTAVDQAETEPDLVMKVNAEAPGIIAEEAKRCDALFINYSSDYVFDGSKSLPYTESDEAGPLNVYGASKLAGERFVQAAGGSYLIFRTSWVFGTRGKNFLRTMLNLISTRDEVKVVDDQIGAPTWSREIARAALHVLEQLAAEAPAAGRFRAAQFLADRQGIYHMTSAGSVSWFGFANAIQEEMKLRCPEGQRLARIVPISSEQFPAAAARPKNSRLSNEKLGGIFGVELPPWRALLTQAIDEIEMPWRQETAPGVRTGLRQ